MKKVTIFILLLAFLICNFYIVSAENIIIAEILLETYDGLKIPYFVYHSGLVNDDVQIDVTLSVLYTQPNVKRILLINDIPIEDTEYNHYSGDIVHQKKDNSSKVDDSVPGSMRGLESINDMIDSTAIENAIDNSLKRQQSGEGRADSSIVINGKAVSFSSSDATPYMNGMRVMVPFRDVFEAMGADVGFKKYSDDLQIVTAVMNGIRLEMKVGDYRAYRNGNQIFMDTVPEIKNGKVYVPLYFVSQLLGMELVWDRVSNKIIVNNILD